MAQQSWTYDAPTGVYKNHALASDIRMAAIAMTQFVQFSKPVDGYGAGKGSNVTITRVSNVAVPSDDSLDELNRIPEDTLSLSTQAISVVERGRAIPYTSLSLDLAHFDLESAIQKKLRDQLALRLDILCATAFKVGQVKAIPDGIASLTMDTDGTASTTAAANLNVYHMEVLRDQLFSTYNIAPYEGGDYMMVASTKAIRGLKRDPNWEKWKVYTEPSAKFNSEVGKMEGIRIIETNNSSALSGSLGSGSVLGEAVVFGDDPVAMATVKDPELRAKESEDYGRSKGVAWYGIYGYDQIWKDSATAGEARVIHITSA
jgi:N4-gp56 family major capsid protein